MRRIPIILAAAAGLAMVAPTDAHAKCDESKLPTNCGRWVIKQGETDIPLVRMTPALRFVAIYRVCLHTRNATVTVKSLGTPAVTVTLSSPDAQTGPPVCADISALPNDTLSITRIAGTERLVGSYHLVFGHYNG